MTELSIIHNLEWRTKSFQQLSVHELYAVLALRSAVFVLEQRCFYQDIDGKDICSHHLMAWNGEHLMAYARLLPPEASFAEPSIGRVLTAQTCRRTGAGKELISRSIDECRRLFGDQTIKIGAQSHLRKFYESYGFVGCSDEYLEDGISHVEMVKRA